MADRTGKATRPRRRRRDRRDRRDREQVYRWLLAEQTWRADHYRRRVDDHRVRAALLKTQRDIACMELAAVERSEDRWRTQATTAAARDLPPAAGAALTAEDGSRWTPASLSVLLEEFHRLRGIVDRLESARRGARATIADQRFAGLHNPFLEHAAHVLDRILPTTEKETSDHE